MLGEKNADVVRLALETLKLLADTPRHRQKLAAVFGVLEALQATADCVDEFGEEIANSAAEIFTCLKFTKNAAYNSKKIHHPQPKPERIPSTEEAPEEDGLFGALDTSSHSDKGHRFLKFNSKAKTITIQVTGLTTQVLSKACCISILNPSHYKSFIIPSFVGRTRSIGTSAD